MGYACPVCGDPQADAGHLANHLAFTALTSGGDHEEWLDERVPEWGEYGEAELAEAVTGEAEEAEYPQVFEASGDALDHDHAGEAGDHDEPLDGAGVDVAAARDRAESDLDEETREVVAEARELTRRRRADVDAEGSGDDGAAETDGDDGDGTSADAADRDAPDSETD